MRLDTTAITEGNGKRNSYLLENLAQHLAQNNISAALEFVRLAKRSHKKAKSYYRKLDYDVQEYVKYASDSQPIYDRLFNKNGNGK